MATTLAKPRENTRDSVLYEAQQNVANEFAQIQQSGAAIVRWFLFGDGRGRLPRGKGNRQKPDDFLFADVVAVLRLAQQHQLKLCFSLIDFLWLQEHKGKRPAHSHEHVLHFAAGRIVFTNILIPLFQEFRGHPALFAWEIANEPEWAIHEFHQPPPQPLCAFRIFEPTPPKFPEPSMNSATCPSHILGPRDLSGLRAWIDLALDSTKRITIRPVRQTRGAILQNNSLLWLRSTSHSGLANSRHVILLSGIIPYRKRFAPAATRTLRRSRLALDRTGSARLDVAIGRVDSADLLAWNTPEKSDGQRA